MKTDCVGSFGKELCIRDSLNMSLYKYQRQGLVLTLICTEVHGYKIHFVTRGYA